MNNNFYSFSEPKISKKVCPIDRKTPSTQIDSAIIFLNNKKIKDAFYNWKFKTEKHKFESKLKNHYNIKRCFRKWLKLKNKRRIINDLINKKKNALEDIFIKKSNNIDTLLLYKKKQYFLGRLKKNINNGYVCNLLDNSYINNYKKKLIKRLSFTPRLIKGITKLDKLFKDIIKKNAIKKMKKKIKINNFEKILKNILYKNLKKKFISKIEIPEDKDNNLSKEESDLIKNAKRLRRIMNKNLKKYAFDKLNHNNRACKNIDKLRKEIEKILKKKFMNKLKEINEKIKGLNKIQKIIENKKCSDLINKLKDIANSPEGIKNQKRIKCIKFKDIIEKSVINKIKKEVFNKIKRKYNVINGSNKINKIMNDRYKKRLFYLIHLIYVYNKPKTSKIKSRYPSYNMTDLSTKIEKLLLKKIKKKFINELKNIKKIDKHLFYMIMAITNRIKKDIFDILKTIYFADLLNHIMNNKKNEDLLKKREFLDKLKAINEKNINDDNMKKDCLNEWNTLTNKNKILNQLKDNLKKEKDFNKWKDNINRSKIINDLKNKQKENIKNKNNEQLKKYLDNLNEKAIRRKVLNDLRKLSKINNIDKIMKDKNKNIAQDCFNKLKNIPKPEEPKKEEKIQNENNNNLKPKNINLKLEKINNTEYKPEITKKPDFVIIKQNIISFNDINKNNINNNINNVKNNDKRLIKRDRSIKKRKIKRRGKSKGKIENVNKNIEPLEKAFIKWKNNTKKMKKKEDFKDVINGLKNINKNNDELLKKLKKANVYLLLDIYKKNRDLLLKKYFNIWVKKVNEMNRNNSYYINKEKEKEKEKEKLKENLKERRNKFTKRQIKINNINNNDNNDKLNKELKDNDNNNNNNKKPKKGDKVFVKKKTKLNLHRTTPYNTPANERRIKSSNFEEDFYRANTERNFYNLSNLTNNSYSTILNNRMNSKINNISILDPDYVIEDIIEEIPSRVYISKSIEKRRPKNHIPIYIEDENYEEYPYESYNKNYIYNNGMEIENNDKNNNNYKNIVNLDKTFSSINYSTNNHFSLIEESNEVRRPTDYTIESIKREKNRKNKIKDLLSPAFDNLNNNLYQYNILTDRKEKKNKKPSIINYDINFTSRSQKNRKKSKLGIFTVSIPLNLRDDKQKDDMNKYSSQKKTPEKVSSNNSNEDKNTNSKTNNNNKFNLKFSTPSNNYSINWEKGNSTCSRIIKNEPNLDYNVNDTTCTNKGRKIKKFKHNKCKSAFEYNSENDDSYYNNINGSNMYGDSRKKLFY